MATYAELIDKLSDDSLRNRVTVAVVIYAHGLITGTPTLPQKKFALDVIKQPDVWGARALNLVLAANESATIAQINAASDATIQNNVNAVGAALVDALEG